MKKNIVSIILLAFALLCLKHCFWQPVPKIMRTLVKENKGFICNPKYNRNEEDAVTEYYFNFEITKGEISKDIEAAYYINKELCQYVKSIEEEDFNKKNIEIIVGFGKQNLPQPIVCQYAIHKDIDASSRTLQVCINNAVNDISDFEGLSDIKILYIKGTIKNVNSLSKLTFLRRLVLEKADQSTINEAKKLLPNCEISN